MNPSAPKESAEKEPPFLFVLQVPLDVGAGLAAVRVGQSSNMRRTLARQCAVWEKLLSSSGDTSSAHHVNDMRPDQWDTSVSVARNLRTVRSIIFAARVEDASIERHMSSWKTMLGARMSPAVLLNMCKRWKDSANSSETISMRDLAPNSFILAPLTRVQFFRDAFDHYPGLNYSIEQLEDKFVRKMRTVHTTSTYRRLPVSLQQESSIEQVLHDIDIERTAFGEVKDEHFNQHTSSTPGPRWDVASSYRRIFLFTDHDTHKVCKLAVDGATVWAHAMGTEFATKRDLLTWLRERLGYSSETQLEFADVRFSKTKPTEAVPAAIYNKSVLVQVLEKFLRRIPRTPLPLTGAVRMGVLRVGDSVRLTRSDGELFVAVIREADGGYGYELHCDAIREPCHSFAKFVRAVDSHQPASLTHSDLRFSVTEGPGARDCTLQEVLTAYRERLGTCADLGEALSGVGLSARVIRRTRRGQIESPEYYIVKWLKRQEQLDGTVDSLTAIGFDLSSAEELEFALSASHSNDIPALRVAGLVRGMLTAPSRANQSLPRGLATTPVLHEFRSRDAWIICSGRDDFDEGKEDSDAGSNEYQNVFDRLCAAIGDTSPYVLFFHGTTWACAAEIMNEGIDLGRSSHNCDFSFRRAFYVHAGDVAAGLVNAAEWPDADPAVIVYFVQLEEYQRLSILDFTDEGESQAGWNWESVVIACRRAHTTDHPPSDIFRRLEEAVQRTPYNLIRGPICINPLAVIDNAAQPRQMESAVQVALRDDRAVQVFNNALAGVMYFTS